jgi:hypothetical protein
MTSQNRDVEMENIFVSHDRTGSTEQLGLLIPLLTAEYPVHLAVSLEKQ